MARTKLIAIYAAGLFSGVSIVGATLSGAIDSSIAYTFKDGQVISADTLNDLFGRIKMVNEGFQDNNELTGAWSCSTIDLSGLAPIATKPADGVFQLDSTLNLYKSTENWTFSNNGQLLTISNAANNAPGLIPGGIANNNGAGCLGQNITYNTHLLGPYLALSGAAGCTNGNGYVLQTKRTSPYDFTAPLGSTVVQCSMVSRPPPPPIDLAASATTSSVGLNWTSGGGTVTEYSVLKKTNGQYSEIATTNVGVTTYTDASGSSGDLYRIKAKNNNGYSIASGAAIAK